MCDEKRERDVVDDHAKSSRINLRAEPKCDQKMVKLKNREYSASESFFRVGTIEAKYARDFCILRDECSRGGVLIKKFRYTYVCVRANAAQMEDKKEKIIIPARR